MRAETANLRTFEASVAAVRARRTEYRRMLADAVTQRSHLLDSMIVEKDMDASIRSQLFKLRALPNHESREQADVARFSPFSIILGVNQLVMLLVFALAVGFPDVITPANDAVAAQSPYSFYTDIALLVLVGLGFLMSFLRKYAYSSLGFTLLLTAFVMQWTILVVGFFQQAATGLYSAILLDFPALLNGMYGVVAVLISFGAVAGKLSPFGMMVMAFWEVIIFGLNYFINALLIGAQDYGYSMYVHLFGAVFGLAASVFISRPYIQDGKSIDESSDYHSDTLTLLGTFVLWVFFPSLNAALVPASAQARTALNTVLALAGGTTFAFCLSRLFHQKRFHMLDIQNATIAAGVAVSSSVSVIVPPGIGLLMGILGSSISVATLTFLTPLLASSKSYVRIHDTRGVLAVHGLPALMAAIAGMIATAIAASDPLVFGTPFLALFPTAYAAGVQAAACVITILLAGVGGLLVGFLVFFMDRTTLRFSDEESWHVPSDFPGVERLPQMTLRHVVR